MRPLTIDFEASCLPRHGRSYPIEVGISDASGLARSWLIGPVEAWRGWTWTEEAEQLHGISREDLERHGQPAGEVLQALCDMVGPRDLVSDSWLDAGWLATLAEGAGMMPCFAVRHVATIVDAFTPEPAQVRQAQALMATLGTPRHRAAPDARRLALWLSALGVAERAEALLAHDDAAAARPIFALSPRRGDGPGQATPPGALALAS